jgi:hypothetical protein
MEAPFTHRLTKEAALVAGAVAGWFGAALAMVLVTAMMSSYSKRVKIVCPEVKATKVRENDATRFEFDYIVDLENIGQDPALKARVTFQAQYGMRLDYLGFSSKPSLAAKAMDVTCSRDSWDGFTCPIGTLNPGHHIYFHFRAVSSSDIPLSRLEAEFFAPGFSQRSSRSSAPGPAGAATLPHVLENTELSTSSFSSLTAYKGPENRTRASIGSERATIRIPSTATGRVGCIIPDQPSSAGETTTSLSRSTAAIAVSGTTDGNQLTPSAATTSLEQDSIQVHDSGSGSIDRNKVTTEASSGTMAGNGLQGNSLNVSGTINYSSTNSGSPSGPSTADPQSPPAAGESLNVKITGNENGQLSANTTVSVTPVVPSGATLPTGCNETAAGAPMKMEVLKSGGAQLAVTGIVSGVANTAPADDKGPACKQQPD